MDDPASLSDKGYALLQSGNVEAARAHLLTARALAPDDPGIRYRLALVYLDSDCPALALEELDAALALDPVDARAHNNRGSALQLLGHLAAAEQSFRRASELAPGLAPPYVNLGHLLEQTERVSEAIALYRKAIDRGLDVATFNQYMAAASGRATLRSPDKWVESTFDNFAPTFDAHLSALQYRVPRQIAAMVIKRIGGLVDIVDLGCGTGQCGLALRDHKRHLVGVDLSPNMVARAQLLSVYDELHVREIHEWLHAARTATFDVAVAADVFIYIGALTELFRQVGRLLRRGAFFAFSTEECYSGNYVLLSTGRYAQSLEYITGLAPPEFALREAKPSVIRMETNTQIHGRLYLFERV